jgi:hypothetical protein
MPASGFGFTYCAPVLYNSGMDEIDLSLFKTISKNLNVSCSYMIFKPNITQLISVIAILPVPRTIYLGRLCFSSLGLCVTNLV